MRLQYKKIMKIEIANVMQTISDVKIIIEMTFAPI